VTGAPLLEDQRFAVRTVYDYLRAKGKPVPTGKPQVAGHKVDLSGLAKACYDAGGRAQVRVCHCSSLYTKSFRMVRGFMKMLASLEIVVKSMRQFLDLEDLPHLSLGCSHASWVTNVGLPSEIVSAGRIRRMTHVINNLRTSEVQELFHLTSFLRVPLCQSFHC
jgi:hypothetical protein